MTQKYAVLVLFALLAASMLTGFHRYTAMKERVDADMCQALVLTMQEQQDNVITPDTIRRFNGFLKMEELRGRATLAVSTRQQSFSCYARCSEATILSLSEQRPTLLLLAATALWCLLCAYWRRTRWMQLSTPLATVTGEEYGGIMLVDGNFLSTASGERIRLTPMQRQLMEMFFHSPTHELSKMEICDALWPKKTDASETLYALVRRIRPIIEKHSRLQIESDRSRAYRLVERP